MSILDEILDTSVPVSVPVSVPASVPVSVPDGDSRAAIVDAVMGSGTQDQLYASGTALWDVGVQQVAALRADWEARPIASVALHNLQSEVAAERRHDAIVHARDLRMTASGSLVCVSPAGKPIAGHGVPSIAAIRDLIGAVTDAPGLAPYAAHLAREHATRELAANVNRYLVRSPADTRVKLRERYGVSGGIVAAVTSPAYTPMDLDRVADLADRAVSALSDTYGPCRAQVVYDGGASNKWSIDLSFERPLRVDGSVGDTDATVGEAHRVGVRITGHDGGGGAVRGALYCERIRCRNATTYTQDACSWRLVHKGGTWRLVSALRDAIRHAIRSGERVMHSWARALHTPAISLVAGKDITGSDRAIAALAYSQWAQDLDLARSATRRNAKQRAQAIVASGGVAREQDILASLSSGAVVVSAMLDAYDVEPGDTAASAINGLTRWAQSQPTDVREATEAFAGGLIWTGGAS